MIDFRQVGNGAVGPITQALLREFKNTVRGKGARSQEWLDFVGQSQVLEGEKAMA
jgi:hypothetical protein